MDLERKLAEHLADVARRTTASPDLAEVELGARRVRGRRRVVTGVAAAMLVAAAGGAGFGLGRSAGGDGDQIVAPADQGAPAVTAAEQAAENGEPVADEAAGTDVAYPSANGPAAVPAPAPPLGAEITKSSNGAYAGGMPAYELVVERQTDSGITIRALRGESWYTADSTTPGPNGWMPARWCWGDADLRIGLSGPGLIDITGTTWYSELPGAVAASVATAGWADGQLMGVVTVQVADGITEVAVMSGTTSDRVAPTGGLAVLLLPGVDLYVDDYTVEVTDADGPRELTAAELDPMSTDEWRAACEPPPPALPDAGEQPADPEAAEAAVRDVFDTLFNSSTPLEDRPDGLFDDETGIDDAAERARRGDYADAVASAVFSIKDFVFTSPTEAWFRYEIDSSMGHIGQRYGTATLIDGSWRLARAVVCQDLALAGAPCEPDVEPIYPPSWYEMYGDPQTGGCSETEEGGTVCTATADYTPTSAPASSGD